jgi:phytoene/squalene synthetase
MRRDHAAPPLLHDLLDAFEQDVRNPLPDRAELLDYCRRSANPVGRLLLHLYGVHDAPSLQRSPTPSAPRCS